MTCPACHAPNKDGAKFCMECGAPLALRCPSCGTPHGPTQKFCDECGTPLAGPAAPPAPAAPGGEASVPTAPAPAPGSTEMRLVSVLFVDLVGFTSLSEGRDAEDVRELLGRYFEDARTIVERYGGTIEKFIGDAVMAVWGVPVAREDDAERAVRAALDVIDAVSVFGAASGAPDLRARAGVVTGQVAALENPGEGLVVGDRVNTASRVQSAATPGSVFVDEVTRSVTSAAIAYEDAGEHTVKGKADPLRLWRALRVVAGVGGTDREQGVEAPFVGRDGDLRLLKELFHGALERQSARLVAVFGEAGVGKSRLRREFTNYVDGLAAGVLWHEGRCLSYGEGVAYWALAEMVRQRLGISEEAGVDDAGARLAAGLERWIPDTGDREFLAPRLGALLGVAQPGLPREELFAGWRLFFERLAAHSPVALVFEDVQWADAGLLDFLEQLLDWSARSPIFILTLSRPELAARPQGWPAGRRGATVLQLEPLDDGAVRELLDGVIDGLPARTGERIVAQAEGVPLYAIETIRALLDRGIVREHDGRLLLEGEVGELDVPATLGSLLAARLDALEPLERRLVKAMSVFGGAFPRGAVLVLGDVPENDVDGLLAALVRKQVLVIRTDRLSPDRGQYAFAQGLLRTVAHGMLSRQERKPRHLAAAAYLHGAFPGDGEEVAEVIAAHQLEAYEAAGEDPDAEALRAQAVAALERAADRALATGAPERAERLLRTGVDLSEDPAERVRLVARAGEMAFEAGSGERAYDLLSEVVDTYREQGETERAARSVWPLSRVLIRLGRNEEAAERAQSALEALAGEPADEAVAGLHVQRGQALSRIGRFDEAVVSLDRGLGIAEALRLPDLIGRGLGAKGSICTHRGRIEEARVLLRGSADLARRAGSSDRLSASIGNLGNLGMEWDLPEAIDHIEEAVELGLRRGSRYVTVVQGGNLMAVHLFRGRWEEAERLAAELLTGEGDEEDLHHRLLLLRVLRGDLTGARTEFAELEGWRDSDETEARALYGTALLWLHVAEGDHTAALQDGVELITWTLEMLAPSNETVRLSWPATLEAALAAERLHSAHELVALIAERPVGQIPPYLGAQFRRGRALLAAAEGRHDEVEGDLRGATVELAEIGYPYWLAVTQTDLAEWLIGQGRSEESAPLLDDALATFTRLGAAPALARAQALRPDITVQPPVEV